MRALMQMLARSGKESVNREKRFSTQHVLQKETERKALSQRFGQPEGGAEEDGQGFKTGFFNRRKQSGQIGPIVILLALVRTQSIPKSFSQDLTSQSEFKSHSESEKSLFEHSRALIGAH